MIPIVPWNRVNHRTLFFLQMIFTASQHIIFKQHREKQLQNNAPPTSTKPCKYSLSARVKPNEKTKQRQKIKIDKKVPRAM